MPSHFSRVWLFATPWTVAHQAPLSMGFSWQGLPFPSQATAQLQSFYMLVIKILQTRLQQYVNCELPDVQTGFRKGEEPEIKLPASIGSQKKQESSRKPSTLLITPKPLTVWITTNCGKFLKRWEYQTTLLASWEICMQVKKQVKTRHGTTDWFQFGKGIC